MKRVRLTTFAALLFAFLVVTPSSAPSALYEVSVNDCVVIIDVPVETGSASLDVERWIILDTVRRYRPTTDEEWIYVLADSVHREATAVRFEPVIEAISEAGGDIVHILEEERQ